MMDKYLNIKIEKTYWWLWLIFMLIKKSQDSVDYGRRKLYREALYVIYKYM